MGQGALEDGNNPNKKEGFNVSYGIGDVKNALSNGSKLSKNIVPECSSEPKFEGAISDWLLAPKSRSKPFLASEWVWGPVAQVLLGNGDNDVV